MTKTSTTSTTTTLLLLCYEITIKTFGRYYPSVIPLILLSQDLEARAAYLEESKSNLDDPGPLHDCVVWKGGGGGVGKGAEGVEDMWWAAVDTAEDGDLSQAVAMTDFDKVIGVFFSFRTPTFLGTHCYTWTLGGVVLAVGLSAYQVFTFGCNEVVIALNTGCTTYQCFAFCTAEDGDLSQAVTMAGFDKGRGTFIPVLLVPL